MKQREKDEKGNIRVVIVSGCCVLLFLLQMFLLRCVVLVAYVMVRLPGWFNMSSASANFP